MSELTPEQLRAREVNTRLEDILNMTRRAHENAVVLRQTSHNIKRLDELGLHTSFIREQARQVTLLIDELIKKIEDGELSIEDFHMTVY